jgi:unsaturated rhamnogalacturonyl hydrolase
MNIKNFKIIFLLCCFLTACTREKPKSRTVTLDYYYNHQIRKGLDGKMMRYHYTWEDTTYSGYSKFGNIFRKNGVRMESLNAAPTAQALAKTDIYIIVDPNTRKVNPDPHYIEAKTIKVIDNWVASGGVLVLFANDSADVELPHFNNLAETFGIHFNNDFRNPVPNDSFNLGCFIIPENDPIFKTAKKIFLKGICTLSLSGNAKPELSDNGDIIIATAKYGKGTVFAVGDPWFYNEYVNGRIPASYHVDNYAAANDLIKWLIKQCQ